MTTTKSILKLSMKKINFNKSIATIGFWLCFSLINSNTSAQDSLFIRQQIDTLCSKDFAGRGYVDSGVQKAAHYLAQMFATLGLQPLNTTNNNPISANSFLQAFKMNVNTFPDEMNVKFQRVNKLAGIDYLIDGYSPGGSFKRLKTKLLDASNMNQNDWYEFLRKAKNPRKAYVLRNIDSLQKKLKLTNRQLASSFPTGVFILPKKSKPLWWPGTSLNKGTVVYWFDTFQNIKNNKKIDLVIEQKFESNMVNYNVAGLVKGNIDSYIVFTAHYDHLGKMGKDAMFPGASDNASGTAMMLSLAKYFSQHPQRYNIVFIGFSGEEAGLLGSKYFTENPLIELKKIKFLINTDIMGDASGGISVVNGVGHEKEYNLLKNLNPINKINDSDTTFILKEIRKGENASNSDHAYFVEAGVPAFFIFSIGGKGFYHDTWDKPETLSLENIETVRKLLIQFAEALQE